MSRLVRGLGALAVLAVLLVAVPVLLVAVAGFPLPTSVPTLDQVGDALTRTGVPAATIVKAVAVVVWLGWVQLLCAVVAAALEQLRHVPAARGPVAGPLRRTAGHLVAAVVALAAPLGALQPAGASQDRVGASTSLAVALSTAGATTAPTSAATAADSEAVHPAAETWVVRPRDTWWGIAEATLGEGERWRELRRWNAGHEVAPGVVLDPDGQDLRAGWVLRLPISPASPAVTPLPVAPLEGAAASVRLAGRPATESDVLAAPRQVVRVAPGDTLVAIARRVYGDAGQWRRIWDANRGRRFGSRTFDDPGLILVGWDLEVPLDGRAEPDHRAAALQNGPPADGVAVAEAVAGPSVAEPPMAVAGRVRSPEARTASPTTTQPAADTAVPTSPRAGGRGASWPGSGSWRSGGPVGAGAVLADSASSPGTGPVASSRPAAGGAGDSRAVASGVAGATLLATGITGLVASRRRRRLERAGRGSAVAPPDPDLIAVERAARLGADPLGTARLDVALRALAAAGLASGGPVRPVAVRRTASGDLDVLLAEPARLAGPWIGDRDERVWSLPASVPLAALAAAGAGAAAPCPAVVLLGVDGGHELYLDLEAVGSLVLEGPPAAARAIARAVVAGLAVSPLADRVQVVAAGTDCFGFANEARVVAVADAGAALELVAPTVGPITQACDAAGVASTFALRAARPDELWEPSVVIAVGGASAPDDIAELVALAGAGGRGVAVLTDAPVATSPWRLRLDGEGWCLEPMGASVVPQGLSADELADLGALVADASVPLVTAAPTPVRRPAPFEEPPWALQVRLLGPVEVVDREGRAASFDRSKALELVAWLAQHRVRPTRTGARTALWDAAVRDATFANVVSDARRALARLVPPPDGTEWIGRTYAEDLPLHPLVVTDADLLAARLDHARGQGADLAAVLRDGLVLVRDVPYAGTTYLWPDGEALPSHLTLLVIDAAVELATRYVEAGDLDGVFWATAQGMKVLPGHEELVALRLRAHALQGNLAAVRQEYESYERSVTSDPWADGEPSPKVVAVRNELLRPAPAR